MQSDVSVTKSSQIVKKQKPLTKKSFFNSPKVAPYVFISPFIISFLLFLLYPTISTIIMSFQDISGPGTAPFVGLKNYAKLGNEHYFNALKTSSEYTILTLLILIPLPLLLAVLLNSKNLPGRNFFRSALFMPALTSIIVAGIFFRYTFGQMPTALINSIIALFGHEPVKWLQNWGTAMFALVVLATWRWLGVNIIYFLSALQSIPAEQYESADIDGANAWNKLIKITIPSLKPVIIYVLTISVYGGYAMFAESFAYWQTSTTGDIGLTIVQYLYQTGFNQANFGLGSAVGITLLAIVFVVNLIQLTAMGFFKKESDL